MSAVISRWGEAGMEGKAGRNGGGGGELLGALRRPWERGCV